MKEIIVKIPDESSEFITQLLEKPGAEITHNKTVHKSSVKKEQIAKKN